MSESFVQKLDKEAFDYFNELKHKPFKDQAIAVLNAYWAELKDQADIIYDVYYKQMIMTDMKAKNIDLIHKYDEGNFLELNFAFYFYENLNHFIDHNVQWKDSKYQKSQPEMLTAIVRKNSLKDRVDVTISQHVSLLEVLLDQYRETANINPSEFVRRAMAYEEHPEIRKAMQALEEVNQKIKIYENKKADLTEKSLANNIKGNQAKHELAIFENGPEREQLNEAFLHAEALLRSTKRKFGKRTGPSNPDDPKPAEDDNIVRGSDEGTIFWMNKSLEEKKRYYSKK